MKKSSVRLANFMIPLLLPTILIFSACSSSPSEPFPTGTYAPPVQRTPGITMIFSEDGNYVLSGPQLLPIQGTYTIDGDKIVFNETEGGQCTGISGTYTWRLDKGSLMFEVLEDQCSIRRIDWQAGSWAKQ